MSNIVSLIVGIGLFIWANIPLDGKMSPFGYRIPVSILAILISFIAISDWIKAYKKIQKNKIPFTEEQAQELDNILKEYCLNPELTSKKIEAEISSDIVRKSRAYAIKCHAETNHTYGNGVPYSFHLDMVYLIGNFFLYLIPEKHRDNYLGGLWVHDCVEDCRQTYNDVKEATNENIADVAYALTNEKGKNRKQRGSDKYYKDMKRVPYAVCGKLCDRIANVFYSKFSESRMFNMYCKENTDFSAKVSDDDNQHMITYLSLVCKK